MFSHGVYHPTWIIPHVNAQKTQQMRSSFRCTLHLPGSARTGDMRKKSLRVQPPECAASQLCAKFSSRDWTRWLLDYCTGKLWGIEVFHSSVEFIQQGKNTQAHVENKFKKSEEIKLVFALRWWSTVQCGHGRRFVALGEGHGLGVALFAWWLLRWENFGRVPGWEISWYFSWYFWGVIAYKMRRKWGAGILTYKTGSSMR